LVAVVAPEPEILDDIKWLGINIMACGSSHADDYGPDTILKTIEYLDAAGIAIVDLQLRRPSLDDVFLTLTGHQAEDKQPVETGRRRRGRG